MADFQFPISASTNEQIGAILFLTGVRWTSGARDEIEFSVNFGDANSSIVNLSADANKVDIPPIVSNDRGSYGVQLDNIVVNWLSATPNKVKLQFSGTVSVPQQLQVNFSVVAEGAPSM